MTTVHNIKNQQIAQILQSNNSIKQSTTKTVLEYLKLQNSFFDKVGGILKQINTVQSVADIFLNDEQKKLLNEFKPTEKVQLAICGYNSTGKTTFVHELLECGNFLPTGVGAVSARIVKFSYATANEACLIKHISEVNPIESNENIDLSSYFISPMSKANTKAFREIVKKYVARPSIDNMSDEFEKWASHFIEIRIPSPFLQMGVDIYDTPGFLGHDPPIIAQNLLKLISSVRLSLVYLYDNPVVSDDSRKCFEQLRLALRHHFNSTGIFFLNTKADVLTIRKDAEDDSEDEGEDNDKDAAENYLLSREREKRYQLLLNVNELSSTMSEGKHLSLDQCDCFDIFSSQGSTDPMESKMKQHAINNIIRFAAEHDLSGTKQIINIILGAIDDFFDFVLITNRRSPKEWDKMRDHALQWIDAYFAKYQPNVEDIAKEAKKRLPIKFIEKRDEIVKRAIPHCETTWWERIYVAGIPNDRFGLLSPSAVVEFVNMTIQSEVIKPVLDEITFKFTKNTKEHIDQTKAPLESIKNELLMAAYRAVMTDSREYGSFFSRSSLGMVTKIGLAFASPFIAFNGIVRLGLEEYLSLILKKKKNFTDHKLSKIEKERKIYINEYLVEMEHKIATMNEQIKENIQKWLENSRNEFIHKVKNYHSLVLQTLDKRQEAYTLAREFAPQFARFECCLVANLDLVKHHDLPPIIQRNTVLGSGGFFTIHPATWGAEQNLVVKELNNPIDDRDISYLEAHFHRTVTRLQISHMVPLSYLYETVKDSQQFAIVLPRYSKNLHSYRMAHMQEMTIDKAVQISIDISRAVAHMHAHELVHRDIKVLNILLDAQDQVFLADFGTCQHGTENSTFIGSRPFVPEITTGDHQYSYEGSAFDVFYLGVLMYVVAPKDDFRQPRTMTEADVNSLDRTRVPQRYCNLILQCIKKQPTERPRAHEIVQELEQITDEIANSKPCLVCLDAPRSSRCLPCRHKTMCSTCLTTAQQASQEPQCILCKEGFTSIEADTDPNTFIGTIRLTTTIQ